MSRSEINQEKNELFRLFQKFSRESIIVILACVSVIASILAVLMSWSAVHSSTQAKAMIEYELVQTRQELVSMKNEIRMYEVYYQDLQASMKGEH